MRDSKHPQQVTSARESLSSRRARRRRRYFLLMGLCILLIVLAWNVVRFWSIPAAVIMSAVAAVLPPTAAILANWGEGG